MAEKLKKNLLKSFPNLPPCFFLRENRPLNFFPPIEIQSKNRPRFSFLFLSGKGGLGRPHEKRILGKSTRQSLSLFKRDRPTVPQFHLFFLFGFTFFFFSNLVCLHSLFGTKTPTFIFFCVGFFPIFPGAKVSGAVCNLIISPWKRQRQGGKKRNKGPQSSFRIKFL